MTVQVETRPTRGQQAQAIVALVAVALIVVVVVVAVLRNPAMLVLAVVGLLLAGWGAWWAVTERMPRRGVGIALAAAGLVLIALGLVRGVANAETALLVGVAALVLFGVAAAQARLALVRGLRRDDVVIAPRPKSPVLIANPKSGGGKVASFGLVEKAQAMGVEVVLLNPGDDLEQLARDAIARGADCLGMAGGDGSQALVAAVATEHDLPFVCVSAGTRNHFALDLGLDREDPSTGLVAFSQAIERTIDFATISYDEDGEPQDRLFVNNASMGVYATIVQEEGYRDAKTETSMELLPALLGNADKPFDLQFTGPDGEVDGAFVILVSNNPYVLGPKLDVSQRRSLTTGELGVFAITATTGKEAAALVTRTALGLGKRDPNLHDFTTPEFEVRSRSGSIYVGVDGEALELPAPLRFRSHPRGLRIRVPLDSRQRLERREARNVSVASLVRVASGRPM